jgi:class 3 adenylate cyclase
VIESYSGDVIKFCGDALLVVWPVAVDARAKVREAAVLMACKCALNLVNKSLAPPTKNNKHEKKQMDFRFHCGVSSGIVHGYVVGTTNRLEFLISGDPIVVAGDAASEAAQGQVCVSPDAHAMIQSRFTSEMQPKGNFLLSELILCHQDCFRCAHLSGLYRQTLRKHPIAASADSSPVPQSGHSGEFFHRSLSRPLLTSHNSNDSIGSETHSEAGRSSAREARGSFDENIFLAAARKLKSIAGDGYRVSPLCTPRGAYNGDDGDLDSPALQTIEDETPELFPSTKRAKESDNNSSFLSKLSNTFLFSSKDKIRPVALRLGGTTVASEEADEYMRAYHLELQRTEAEVSDFLRPYTLQAVGSESKCAYAKDISGDAAERFYGLFVGSMVQVALESDMVEFLAEMKAVATVFIDIVGVSEDFSTGATEHPQKAISIIMKTLKRCGGFLRQYLVDDKGCVAIAGFGVPGYCHNDDCVRAVEAAAAISRGLQLARLNCRIGIAVGNVYCGLVGSSHRCEYAMMGASVNLAARLMSKCSMGKILVSQAVRVAAMGHFQFEEHAAIKMKGFKLPVPVFEPTGRFSANQQNFKVAVNQKNHHFVERLSSLQALSAAFEEFHTLAAGDATTVEAHIVDGGSGMGKTAVITELYQLAARYGMGVHSAIATQPSYMGIAQYDTVSQLLLSIAGAAPGPRSRAVSGCTEEMLRHPAGREKEGAQPQPHRPGNGGTMARVRRMSWEADLATPMEPSSPTKMRSSKHVNTNNKTSEGPLTEQQMMQIWFDQNVDGTDELVVKTRRKQRSMLVSHPLLGTGKSNIGSRDSSSSSSSDEDDGGSYTRSRGDSNSNSYSSPAGTPSVTPSKSAKPSSPTASPSASPSAARHLQGFGACTSMGASITVPVTDTRCLLNAIMPVKFSVPDHISRLSSIVRHKLRDSLIIFILRRCAERQQMLLIVNSLQWCDVDSLRVIQTLLKLRLQNCFLLFGLDSSVGLNPLLPLPPSTEIRTSISHESAGARHKDPLARIYSLCSVHVLQPFGPLEIASLVRELLGTEFLVNNPTFLSEQTIHKLLHRTSGVPGLLVALITNLKTSGVDVATLDSLDEQLMSNLAEYSNISIDELDPTDKFILKLCSVIGVSFLVSDLVVLADKVQASHIDMHACLKGLEDKTFLVASNLRKSPIPSLSSVDEPPCGAEGAGREAPLDLRYQFSTSVMHESIYNMMLRHQKRKAHAAYAVILEGRPHVSIEQIDLIIYHYLRSGNISKQYDYLVQGMQSARGSNDGLRIMTYLTEVIKVWTKGSVLDLTILCCTQGAAGASSTLTGSRKQSLRPDGAELAESPAVNPRDAFAATKKAKARGGRLPPYLGTEGVWLTRGDLVRPYIDARGEPEWLPCWLGERSAILFRWAMRLFYKFLLFYFILYYLFPFIHFNKKQTQFSIYLYLFIYLIYSSFYMLCKFTVMVNSLMHTMKHCLPCMCAAYCTRSAPAAAAAWMRCPPPRCPPSRSAYWSPSAPCSSS